MHLCLKLLCADGKSFLACRTAEMSWKQLRGDEKGWSVLGWDENSWGALTEMTCEKRWDEMRRAEMRCDEVRRAEMRWDEVRRAHMIWDEVWSVKGEECSVKCAESLRLALHCTGVARRSCSWTTSVQQLRTKHARTGLAGARCMQVL